MSPATKSTLESLAENAAGSFEAAKSLPPAIYHDPRILELETERIFRRDWVCLGRLAEIPEPGDYVSRDIAGAPVFAARQRDGSVKAFANVCLHRAARLVDGDGHASRISCPYHSWTYDLDGQLVGAPFMSGRPEFDVRSYRLRELRSECWEGFVYVSLDPDAASVAERLAGLSEQIGDYRMADYVPVCTTEETWDTNWKCLVENYMDAYHVHRVHRNSFARHGSSEDRTELHDGNDACTYHYVTEDEGPKAVRPHPDIKWIRESNRHRTWLINIFPSHTMQLQPDMLWYLSILPDGRDRVRIRWSLSLPPEHVAAAPDREALVSEWLGLLEQVNSEDRPVVENVYRATRSPHAEQGPLSHLERNVWQFGRYLARRLCD